jgi:hypothetical protein|tara:strand:+ start:1383 stop:1559 length:177 start_codon:yes stop_codon:yes gene_type:complete
MQEYNEITHKIQVLEESIEVFRSRILPSATGYLYTTISTLEKYIEELEKELELLEQTC